MNVRETYTHGRRRHSSSKVLNLNLEPHKSAICFIEGHFCSTPQQRTGQLTQTQKVFQKRSIPKWAVWICDEERMRGQHQRQSHLLFRKAAEIHHLWFWAMQEASETLARAPATYHRDRCSSFASEKTISIHTTEMRGIAEWKHALASSSETMDNDPAEQNKTRAKEPMSVSRPYFKAREERVLKVQ